MNGCILLVAASLTLVDGPQDGRQSFQLDPQSGQWRQVEAAPPAAPQPQADADTPFGDPGLSRVAARLRQSQFRAAKRDALAWLKANPGSPVYDRGLYLMAEALRGNREFVKAFYYCDELLDDHRDSGLYQDALRLQYEIADAYLLGTKDTLLGLRIVDRKDEATEMLFRIQQRAPGSPVAEDALLRTANYYWDSGAFDLAADAYHAYTQSYPRSPRIPQVKLAEAQSNLAQFRRPDFDSTALLNARTLMRQIAATYPDLARENGVADAIENADRKLARKLYLSADFYRRTGKQKAAAHLCKRLVKLYPDTPEAESANAMLAKLEPAQP